MTGKGRIILPGGAGLVGFNLVIALRAEGWQDIVVIDKHRHNLALMSELFCDVNTVEADLAQAGDWSAHFQGAEAVVMLQAQIGSNDAQSFERNNISATRNVLDAAAAAGVDYLVHISSSVVESVAEDSYTHSKREQEAMVRAAAIPGIVLRPTLMFGWFDRKHLGWLSRFMARVPLFPVPGHGRYARQPLYAMDLCRVILACIEQRINGDPVNITGLEQIDYIDLIRAIKRSTGARCLVLPIPYWLFATLLWFWALFDRDPPFTVSQLRALVQGDEFELSAWPSRFGVEATDLQTAIEACFNDPQYSQYQLKF
jgi:nucleoside-diphosphate-sugar epimerase